MITIAEYAQSRKISYEAARKQVVRYAADLADHITKQGRKQYLDGEAVLFLDQHRIHEPIVLENANAEREEMLEEITALKKQLAEMSILQKWYDDSHLLIDSYKTQVAQLQETADQLRQDKLAADEQLQVAQSDKDAAIDKAHAAELETVELRAQIEKLRSRGLIKRIFNME